VLKIAAVCPLIVFGFLLKNYSVVKTKQPIFVGHENYPQNALPLREWA
jgi:hypothetical protein